MCWIVYKPAEVNLPSGYIIAARRLNNDDGAGVMYVDNKRVVIEKNLGKSDDDVRNLYERHQHRTIAFHVRNSTLGAITVENSHPYWVTNKDWGHKFDIAMMHNGTIQDVQVDNALSDSHNFAMYFMRPVLEEHPELYLNGGFWNLISGLIKKNKLVFMDNRGKCIIVNSALGRIMNPFGVWVSSDAKLTPVNLPAATTEPVPVFNASKDLPKGVEVDGYWVAEDDGFNHFRANEPRVTLESLIGSDRKDVFDLVRRFPSLATDFLMAVLENRNAA